MFDEEEGDLVRAGGERAMTEYGRRVQSRAGESRRGPFNVKRSEER